LAVAISASLSEALRDLCVKDPACTGKAVAGKRRFGQNTAPKHRERHHVNDTSHDWHAMEPGAAAEALGSDLEGGLSEAEARRLLSEHGPNALPRGTRRTLLGMFLGQFKDFLVWILIAAAVVSAGVGETPDALVIAAILVLNAVLGVVQQYKANQALEALREYTVPEAEVIRGGRPIRVSAESVVPGDLVTLREGASVPADLRLVEVHSLHVDESALTGESEAVEKAAEALASDLAPPERRNLAFAGTTVTAGRARGLVVATGADREIGRIAGMLEEVTDEATPLEKRLARFGRVLGIVTLLVCAGAFGLGILRGHGFLEVFMTAVSLAVAAIPEGLPAIVTVALALGVYRMSRYHAIVRKMPAVETLGCATVICTDKTGTLTENRMTVTEAIPAVSLLGGEAEGDTAAEEGHRRLARIAALCNDAVVEEGGDRVGDPTELALVEFAREAGLDVEAVRRDHPRLSEVPFDSDRKRMSTLHEMPDGRRVLAKGAPGAILERCAACEAAGGEVRPLTDADRQAVAEKVEAMAAEALRVLAYAWKDAAGAADLSPEDESDLVLAGLTGMRDPPREEVPGALAEAHDAGIRTMMMTGDNLVTARAIAADLGMLEEGDEAVTGDELAETPEEDLARRAGRIRVFARVWPEQKLKIVRALQSAGQVVAMTGDGVNDAPALQQADIGVAMGLGGTDVAKEAADLVLTDDNFATIVRAVRQGRIIFDNIRKFVSYLLACNLGELLAILAPYAVGWKAPLIPVQILIINLVTDGLPAMALGVDTPEPGIMKRRPRPPKEGILTSVGAATIGVNAVFIALATVAAFAFVFDPAAEEGTLAKARTMAFVTLALAELWRAQAARSERRSVWQINPLSNRALLGASAASALVVLAVVLVPPLRPIAGTTGLSAVQWGWALVLSIVPLVAFEVWKLARRIVRSA
jgi:Ca2+-transporting ATPase